MKPLPLDPTSQPSCDPESKEKIMLLFRRFILGIKGDSEVPSRQFGYSFLQAESSMRRSSLELREWSQKAKMSRLEDPVSAPAKHTNSSLNSSDVKNNLNEIFFNPED